MVDSESERIAKMYKGDCAWAVVALAALWLTIAFVFAGICVRCEDHAIIAALAGGAAVLLLLNTASILALIRHYTADKAHLYGLDIFYIDAARRAKREAADVR